MDQFKSFQVLPSHLKSFHVISPYFLNALHKRYLDFVNNQDVWLWPCNPDHSSGKFSWEYDSTTGLIKSVGSETKYPENPFCWRFPKYDSNWKQRVKIAPCDENDVQQKFDYVNGRIHSRSRAKLCVGFDVEHFEEAGGKTPVTMMTCFGTVWGQE